MLYPPPDSRLCEAKTKVKLCIHHTISSHRPHSYARGLPYGCIQSLISRATLPSHSASLFVFRRRDATFYTTTSSKSWREGSTSRSKHFSERGKKYRFFVKNETVENLFFSDTQNNPIVNRRVYLRAANHILRKRNTYLRADKILFFPNYAPEDLKVLGGNNLVP